MTASMPPPVTNVSDLLHSATKVFRATAPKCLPFAMVAVLVAELPNIFWIASGHQVSFKVPDDSTYQGLAVLGWVFEVLLFATMMLRQRALVTGSSVNASAELGAALQRLPVLLLTFLLAALSVAAGTVLLVLPGIFLAVCFMVALPVVLFDAAGPYSALVRSVKLIRPIWWKALAAALIALLVILVCALAFAAVVGIVAALLADQGPAFTAIETAGYVGVIAVVFVFLSALLLVLHSAASSSA